MSRILPIRSAPRTDPWLPEFDHEYSNPRLPWPADIPRGTCPQEHTATWPLLPRVKHDEDALANAKHHIQEEIFAAQNPQALTVAAASFDWRDATNVLLVDVENMEYFAAVDKLQEVIGDLFHQAMKFAPDFLPLLINVGRTLRASVEMWLQWNVPEWDFGRADGTYTVNIKSCGRYASFKRGIHWPYEQLMSL